MTLIETPRLLLREWQPSDLPAFTAMNCDPDVMRYFPSVLTADESREMYDRIQKHFSLHGFGLYAAVLRNTHAFAGFTGFMIPSFETSFTPCVEIGWRFNKLYWGQGLAKEAAMACLQSGFSRLGFTEVVSFTSVHNHPSEKLMQRIGMRFEKTFMHPRLPAEHVLCEHVLYVISKEAFLGQ